MRRRTPVRYSSLTSLLDVLFILLFAALIHAAASVERARGHADELGDDAGGDPDAAPPAPPRDAGPAPGADIAADVDDDARSPTRRQLYDEARRELSRAIDDRRALYARVSPSGTLASIAGAHVDGGGGAEGIAGTVEATGEDAELELGVPLLERVSDADRGAVYLGERIPDLRVCTIVREQLGRENLEEALVIIAPEVPIADLEVALVRGLRQDQERCLRDEGGLAVVVDPRRAAGERRR